MLNNTNGDPVIGSPPFVGECMIINNTITNTFQRVRVAIHLKDSIHEGVTHVGFASENPIENIYEREGVKICFIRTYAIKELPKMKNEYLFKRISYSDEKKSYCGVIELGGV